MEKRYDGRESNCLDFIRIIAAFQVMLGHEIEHLALPVGDLWGCFGVFFRGVPIFFVISGFLMWFSINRSRTYKEYLKKRFWRIYPELWLAVFIEIFMLILLYHDWIIRDILLFCFSQGTIFQFWTPDCLRGYGVGTPNGALWTIGVMIQFYIVVWFFYKIMKKQTLLIWVLGLTVSFAFSYLCKYITQQWFDNEIVSKLYNQTFVEYFWLFYIGMLMAKFKEKCLIICRKYWLLFIGTAFFFFFHKQFDLFSGYYLFWSMFMTIGIIGFAYSYPRLSISPDISYALFLYHMIVVNIFVHFRLIGSWIYAFEIIGISLLLSYISTVSIGKFSAKKKKILLSR